MTTHRRGRPRRLLVGELVHVERGIMSIGCEVTRIRPTIRVRPVLAGGEPDLDEEAFEVTRDRVEASEPPFLVLQLAGYQRGQLCSGVCRCGREATWVRAAVAGRHGAELTCDYCPSRLDCRCRPERWFGGLTRRLLHGVERHCGELLHACARFNARHPVGSVVRFFPVQGDERHEDRRIRGAADSVHGIAVVWLEGRSGFVACSFCRPVPAAEEAHVGP
jgi:hypothetical protein